MMRSLLLSTMLLSVAAGAQAQVGNILLNPAYYATPQIHASDNNFYGFSIGGFFSITPAGTFTVLNSNYSSGQVCLEQADGTFLAMTGSSNLTKLTAAGTATAYTGVTGTVCPILGSDGNYYGGSSYGGAYGYGYLARITQQGIGTDIYDFPGGSGSTGPLAPLIQGTDGYFYGSSATNFFRYSSAAGVLSTPYQGLNVNTNLVAASDGNFYAIGTTSGQNSDTYLVQIAPGGTAATFGPPYSYSGASVSGQGIAAGSDGSIYPTVEISYNYPQSNCGGIYGFTVQEQSIAGSSGNVLVYLVPNPYDVDGGSNMFFGEAAQDGDGTFFGGYGNFQTVYNGAACGDTTYTYAIFDEAGEVNVPPPISLALSADHILPGKTSTVTWQVNNDFSTTAKQCNGYGLLSGALATSGSQEFSPATAGVYPVSIVCGGNLMRYVPLTVGDTSVTVSFSPSQVVSGSAVTVTASIANDANPVPTGTVTFSAAGVTLGKATVNSSGQASITASSAGAPPSTYAVTAKYSGDANYAAATSPPGAIQILPKGVPQIALTPSSQTVTSGSTTAAFSAVIIAPYNGHSPTGTLSFYCGSLLLGSAPLSVTYSESTATFSASSAGVPGGTYSIVASYPGDAWNAPSVSDPVIVNVKVAGEISLNIAPNPVPAAQSFTLSTTVTGTGTPSGTVTFYAGTTQLGSNSLQGGSTSITLPSGTLAAGSYQVTAQYAGNTENLPITSAPVTLTIQ